MLIIDFSWLIGLLVGSIGCDGKMSLLGYAAPKRV